MGLVFPKNTNFQFLRMWGGLREEGEMLKMTLPAAEVESLVGSLKAKSIARGAEPQKWTLDKYPEWDLPSVVEGFTVVGQELPVPGSVSMVVAPSNEKDFTVYIVHAVAID